jgi:hypothetical protein
MLAGNRVRSAFGQRTIAVAVDGLVRELELLRCESAVISRNSVLRGVPLDPGIAVYFRLKGAERVLACDKWRSMEENAWAIAKHVEAIRGQQRWGVGSVDQAFAGYTAIPESTGGEAWFQTLGVDRNASEEAIRAAWREKAKVYHPDAGGSNQAMARINAALEVAIKSRRAA